MQDSMELCPDRVPYMPVGHVVHLVNAEYLPPSHRVHLVALGTPERLETRPRGQCAHRPVAGTPTFPLLQGMHATPFELEVVPSVHVSHRVLPESEDTKPIGHTSHCCGDDPPLYFPALHSVQCAPVGRPRYRPTLPAGQSTQPTISRNDPFCVPCFPAGHGLHGITPLPPNCPLGHASHRFASTLRQPEGHSKHRESPGAAISPVAHSTQSVDLELPVRVCTWSAGQVSHVALS